MLKMVDGTGIIGVDMVCPLGGTVSPPQPPNYDNIEMEGVGSLMLPNSLKAPLERVELIGNSVQGENPAPDNPKEIKSAGRKSKNLLIENISVFTVQDNIAYITLPEGHETKLYTMLIQKKLNKNDDIGFSCGFYDKANMTATYSTPCLKDGNLVTTNGVVNSKVGVNHFVCFAPADSRFFDIYNVMYAEGKEITLDYEPYGYLLDVKVTGKNLLSNKPADWMIGKSTSWGAVPQTPVSYGTNVKNAIATINVKSSTNYTFINKDTNKLWVCRIIEQDENGLGYVNHALYVNESLNYKKYNFSTRSNTSNIVFEIKKVDNTELLSTDIESIKIMLVEGEADENAPYEPYTEQTLILTSDRPITKWDKLVEQGGQYGWLYKHRNITFNGGETWKIHSNNMAFYTEIADANFQNSFCDKYRHKLSAWARQEYGIYSDNNNAQKYFRPPHEGFEMNVDVWKAFLNKNPLTVIYESMSTEFIPLSESEQTQLGNLHSYNGATHITVDSGEIPCGIKLTYRKEI